MVPTPSLPSPSPSALACARSVVIGDASLRPVFEINPKANFESLLDVPVPNGPLVSIRLDGRHAKFLLTFACTWHLDAERGVREDFRGFRTATDLGAVYAEMTGGNATMPTVRQYVSFISTRLRKAARAAGVPARTVELLDILRRPRHGYQIGEHGMEIRFL